MDSVADKFEFESMEALVGNMVQHVPANDEDVTRCRVVLDSLSSGTLHLRVVDKHKGAVAGIIRNAGYRKRRITFIARGVPPVSFAHP
ncbi:hypothetical protein BV22DRAFT_1040422 [Leucogyrophana mollusca]|uniref:Uncharacterized protein n=1 Tax=Leucogyrophana mollusca TaxID=85980 RepID=A0ACB8B4D0_9AGAM|nr:hypothetical protein BV22DRAFT_1040422 [Leucogyrophana mollusca]